MNKLKKLFTEVESAEAVYVGAGWVIPQKSLLDRVLKYFKFPRYCYNFKDNDEYHHVSDDNVCNKDDLTLGKKVTVEKTYLKIPKTGIRIKEIDKKITV